MSQKYQELKENYESVIHKISSYHSNVERKDIESYLISCTMRIWASNKYYTEEYGKALSFMTGQTYSIEQIVTAMSCCGEGQRKIKVPEFLKTIGDTENRKEIIDDIGDFLAAAALINGDFTVKEAACWSEITDSLIKQCIGSDKIKLSFNPKNHITVLNESGYMHPVEIKQDDSDRTKEKEASTEVKNNSSDTNDDKVDELSEKVNTIINVLKSSGAVNEDKSTENAKVSTQDDKSLELLLEELDSLVGLEKVKKDVRSLMNFIKVSNLRREKGLKIPTISYHLVFTGNPGTGKTTIARLVAQLYYKMGILAKGQLVETDRSALVAGYLGQTAIKTQKVIQEALGGVLFIDEAYALAGDNEDSYGKEAIETLLKAMEDHRDDLVVIVAGYDELMHKFINSNPGLRSRFNKFFHFPDYQGEELVKIFEGFCDKNGYCIGIDSKKHLLEKLNEAYENREEHFGNARTVRNVFETAICCQADRIAQLDNISDEQLVILSLEDISSALKSS